MDINILLKTLALLIRTHHGKDPSRANYFCDYDYLEQVKLTSVIQQHSIALPHISNRPLNACPVAIPGHQVLPVHHEALVRVLAGLQEDVVGRHHVESFVGEVFESLLDTAADESVLC